MRPSDVSPADACALAPHQADGSEALVYTDAQDASAAQLDRETVIEALRACYDPCCRERGVSIVDLGLLHEVRVEGGRVSVAMLLTSGWCPFSVHLEQMIEAEVRQLPGVEQVEVEILWNPVWTPERMSEDARRRLTLPLVQLLPLREARLREPQP